MLNKNLNISLLPLEINWEDKAYNLSKLENCLKLLHPKTDLVVLPETFSTGFPSGMSKEDVECLAENTNGLTINFIKRLAREHNIAIAGSFICEEKGKLFNRAFFVEPTGDEYFADKRHLFTMAGEDKLFSNGAGRMKIRYRGWNISMIVCYDIRFPVWCRNRNNEYDLLLAVANWPVPRIDAWNKLLLARAIENQAYVAGVDCKGTDSNGYEYDGSSAVIDFKGKEIGKVSGPFIYATLSYEKLSSFRQKFPAWQDSDPFTLIE